MPGQRPIGPPRLADRGGGLIAFLPLLLWFLANPVYAQTSSHLGVFIQNVGRPSEGSGAGPLEGVVVLGMMRHGPAERAGIQRGDVLLRYDGQSIHRVEDLQRLVSQTPQGHTVAIDLVRGDQSLVIPVKVEPSPTSLPITGPPDMVAALLQRSEIIWIFFGTVALVLLIIYLVSTVPAQRRRPLSPIPGQRERLRGSISRHELFLAAAGLMLVVVAWSGVTVIEAGHRGVVFHLLRGVRGETLQEGTHVLIPLLSRVTVYDMRSRLYDVRSPSEQPERRSIRAQEPFLWMPTADGLKVGLDLSVRYRLDPTRLPELHRSVGPEVEEKIVYPVVRNVTRLVASEYSLLDIYGKRRHEIQQQAFDRVQAHFARDGLICDALLLQDVFYTEDFEKTLVTKMIAEQKVQETAFEVEQAELRAQAQVIEAHGEAQALAIVNEVIRDQPLLLNYLWIRNLPERVKIIVVPNRAGKAMPWSKPPSPKEERVHAPGPGSP